MAADEQEQHQQDYTDALALINCLSEVCPRSPPSDTVVAVASSLWQTAGIEDTILSMRSMAIDLKQSLEYVAILADAWRRLRAKGIGPDDITKELQDKDFDWRKQDEQREVLAAAFQPGWRGVRFEEMLLGCGIGDAFGAGVEFWDCQWIHANVDGSAWVCRRGDPVLNFYYAGSDLKPDGAGAGQNFLPGMYTDDLEMTLGLVHALLETSPAELTEEVMLQFWKDEYFKAQTHYLLTRFWALGGMGRNGHGGIASVYSGSSKIESMRARIAGMEYPGNAPPMRALPLAFVENDATLLKLAKADADSTHPHVKARAASLGIAITGRHYMLEKASPLSIIQVVAESLKSLDKLCDSVLGQPVGSMLDEETILYLEQVDSLPAPGPLNSSYESFMTEETLVCLCGPQPIWRGPDGSPPDCMPRMVRGLNADAQRTFGCVLYLLKHHNEGMIMETLLRSVCIGGDVDSLAALCLSMIGGREGLHFGTPTGLPMYLLRELESVEYIVETAKRFEQWARSSEDSARA